MFVHVYSNINHNNHSWNTFFQPPGHFRIFLFFQAAFAPSIRILQQTFGQICGGGHLGGEFVFLKRNRLRNRCDLWDFKDSCFLYYNFNFEHT